MFFFFQAEDGIRVRDVTGVQTCALPILVTNGTQVKILAWYDNEWGYASRYAELAQKVARAL